MARIIYALSGQGRGHTSRVIAISDALRRRGHEVMFCCGGTALDILTARGEPVLRVPALRQTVRDNRLQIVASARRNGPALQTMPQTVARLAGELASLRPDLLITDFEAFSPRAARRIGLPVLSFNHQQMVTATRYPLPLRYRLQAALASCIIRQITPRNPAHLLLTSFFFPPLKDPLGVTLTPPILRPAVQALIPEEGRHVLVYWNHPAGNRALLDALRQVRASFIVYNVDPPACPADYPNVQFKTPSEEGFLEDLTRCRAVVCTAGFTLISEALYLGKPLLVAPNEGLFEQTLNALFLHREGLGEAVAGRPLAARDVTAFLARLDGAPTRRPGRAACGNPKAVACIEAVLARLSPSVHRRPALPYRAAAPLHRTPGPAQPQQEPV